MKRIICVKQPTTAPFQLTWLLNNICPNHCSYCPSSLHDGSNHHYDWNRAKEFLKILFEKHPHIHCSIAGGEPTLSPFFKDLVKIFYDLGNSVGITTNGVRTVRFWTEVAPYLNYICCSYHPEFPDPEFEEKIEEMSKFTMTTVRVMMLPQYWDECAKIFKKFSYKSYINVEPVRVLDWAGPNRTAHVYTEYQLQWFIEHGHHSATTTKFPESNVTYPELSATFRFDDNTVDSNPNIVEYINKGMTNFNGYECSIGLKELFVSWSGDIYLGNCHVGGIIGNINEPSKIKWPTMPSICSKMICHCSTDVVIDKRIS